MNCPQQGELHFDLSRYREDFSEWLLDNQHIWRAFVREADKVWNRGRRHYSARTIIEVLRHESTLSEASGEYKINGNYVPDLARLYQETHPDRASLFETRLPRNARRAA